MERIVLGEEICELFRAQSGWMAFSATPKELDPLTLVLANVDYKPIHTAKLRVSPQETRRFLREVLAQAKWQGYTMVVLEGVRTTGANPGHSLWIRRKV